MTTTGRRIRGIAAAALVLLTLAGTAWGADDDFPFGPFRMYATSGRVNGTVRTADVFAVLRDGSVVELHASDVGLRRAELEGQLPRLRANPALLGELAGPEHVAIRLVEHVRRVVDRRVQPEVESRVLAEWTRP